MTATLLEAPVEAPEESENTMRAYRFALVPTHAQLTALKQHAGAARWSFNHALGHKVAAHQTWRAAVDELIAAGVPEETARKKVKIPVPDGAKIAAQWRETRGDNRVGTGGLSPWWHEVSSHAISTGFRHADAAWQNWLESFKGTRRGNRVGYPRFKAKGRAEDRFSIFHDVEKPTIRTDGYRRLLMPNIGSVRLEASNKRLTRLVQRGEAVVKSVTVSRGGTRWYASVLVELTPAAMAQREIQARQGRKASKKLQASRPTVGVEWGVRTLVTLSNTVAFENPKIYKKHERRLRKAAQAVTRKPYTRGAPSSANRTKAVARLGRVHHEIAEERKAHLHELTSTLALGYPELIVRDLAVKNLTKSAKRAPKPHGAKLQTRFNRDILDTAPGMLKQFLAYKTAQYGTKFRVAPKDLPSSQTCSDCGWRDPSIPVQQLVFHCGNCGRKIDREVNAARNIRDFDKQLAPGIEESLNACGDGVGPPGNQGHLSVKQEGRPPRRSPRGSNSPASPH